MPNMARQAARSACLSGHFLHYPACCGSHCPSPGRGRISRGVRGALPHGAPGTGRGGLMAVAMTREQAAAAVAAATAERDGVQVNLLDLDGSFGKRLLAGATLTGQTRARWESAGGELIRLWETYAA